MKQNRILILLLLVAALLCGCAEAETTYTVSLDGTDFTVDTENGTISDGQHTYTYTVTGGGNSSTTTITYPNGATYYMTWSGNSGHGGWSDDYDEQAYTDADTLLDVLSANAPRERSGNPLLGLLLIALGAWYTFAPYSAWFISYGWRYKDAEPSNAALGFSRVGGVIFIIFGIVVMFA